MPAYLYSPLGLIELTEEQGMLSSLIIKADGATHPESAPCATSPVLELAAAQLKEYFAGTRREFSLPLRLPAWQPFSRQVLDTVRTVSYGTTLTYGEVARRAGSARAARAVGRVMAANPLPIIIPCHRVVAAGGLIGGYSGGSGCDTKRWLLNFERAHGYGDGSPTC